MCITTNVHVYDKIPEPNRLEWTNMVKKVKSSDQCVCGNIMAEYKDKIIIIEGDTIKSHEYIIPKSKVDHYDENDLYLNISRHDMILNFEFWRSLKS